MDESGQAVVEYVLMLALVVSLVGIMFNGFRRSLFKLWRAITKEVVAGCPGCPTQIPR